MHNLYSAVVLLDRWIRYAHYLEIQAAHWRAKYNAAHERCEQLREIVAKDYPPVPF